MGRKSRQRRKKGDELLETNSLMTLCIDNEEKPMNAKQSSKLKKKLRKQMKKLGREDGKYNRHKLEQRTESEKAKRNVFHRIKVHGGGNSIEKNFLYTSIGNFVDVQFQPLGFHKTSRASCFYLLENEPAASAIEGLNKRLPGTDGSLLCIQVNRCQNPDLVLNSEQMEVLKSVLAKRFDASSCLLDLTDLIHDSDFIAKDILGTLASPLILKQVFRIIRENVPHIKALNLSKNYLRVSTLKTFQNLHTEKSQLSALNLSHNSIGDIQVLKYIKMFPITELNLEFNPLVDRYKETPVKYVTVVKKELPGLKLLDGVDVEAYLQQNGAKLIHEPKLHLGESSNASTSSNSNSNSSVSEEMVRTYLDQYYSLIDTPQRNNLVAAYTPDAVLEVKSTVSAIGSGVFVGQEKIGEALGLLPATQHQHSSFSLDVKSNVSTAQAIVKGQCQVAGIDSVITFSHSMNIVPFGAGFCCSQALLEMR